MNHSGPTQICAGHERYMGMKPAGAPLPGVQAPPSGPFAIASSRRPVTRQGTAGNASRHTRFATNDPYGIFSALDRMTAPPTKKNAGSSHTNGQVTHA